MGARIASHASNTRSALCCSAAAMSLRDLPYAAPLVPELEALASVICHGRHRFPEIRRRGGEADCEVGRAANSQLVESAREVEHSSARIEDSADRTTVLAADRNILASERNAPSSWL
jgi:hypothetical protein